MPDFVSGDFLGIPIRVDDDLPEGWVFIDKAGTLEPFMAFEPEEKAE